jgi:hypothetical protein
MFDHVERRAFLVKPSRKDPLEPILRAAHVELDEGAGELLLLPRRGGFAGSQPYDDVSDAQSLARLQRHFP